MWELKESDMDLFLEKELLDGFRIQYNAKQVHW